MFLMNVEVVESVFENLIEVKFLINKNVKEIKKKEIVSLVNKENNEKNNYLRKIIGYYGLLKNVIS